MGVVGEEWVVASGNRGKLREIEAILAPRGIHLIAQGVLGIQEVPETGLTFVENALIKARNAAHHSGLPALADDSGISVEALDGMPGIYSARYAGESATDQENLEKLLHAMEEVADGRRAAAFICAMVFMRHADDPTPIIAEGVWRGQITTARAGSRGFGYDPIFWVPDRGCTSAELSSETKNSISHRGLALAELESKLDRERVTVKG